MNRLILNCDEPGWDTRLRDYLRAREDVDLINVDLKTHKKFCESLALNFSMQLRMEKAPSFDTAHFRKPSK